MTPVTGQRSSKAPDKRDWVIWLNQTISNASVVYRLGLNITFNYNLILLKKEIIFYKTDGVNIFTHIDHFSFQGI